MHPGPYNPQPGGYPPAGRYNRNVPRYGHAGGGAKRGGCSCMKWMCCCCCSFFMTGGLILTAIVVSFVIIKPQSPKYDFDSFEVLAFNISDDLSLKYNVIITVKADNPNKYIEIIYGKGSTPSDNSLQVLYSNATMTVKNFAAGKKADISDTKYDYGIYMGKSFFKLPNGNFF